MKRDLIALIPNTEFIAYDTNMHNANYFFRALIIYLTAPRVCDSTTASF